MCGVVSSASHAPSNSPRSPSFPVGAAQPEVLWRDDNFTAYREKANPVSTNGHITIAFKYVPLLFLAAYRLLISFQPTCPFDLCTCRFFRTFVPPILLTIALAIVFKRFTPPSQHPEPGETTSYLFTSSVDTLCYSNFCHHGYCQPTSE